MNYGMGKERLETLIKFYQKDALAYGTSFHHELQNHFKRIIPNELY